MLLKTLALLLLLTTPAVARRRSRLGRYGAPGAPLHMRPRPTLPNVTLGPIEVVIDWPTQHCTCAESPGCTDPRDPDYPDTPPRAYNDGRGVSHLWSTDAESRQALRATASPGATFFHNCTVHAPSAFDCRPSALNFQTWLHSPYKLPGGDDAFAAVHMEYHGWSCVGNSSCAASRGGNCANEAVLLYASRDSGYTWAPAQGAPGTLRGNLLAASPYTYEHARDAFNESELGFGDPSAVVWDPASSAFYVLVSASNPPIGMNGC